MRRERYVVWPFDEAPWSCSQCSKVTMRKEEDGWFIVHRCTTRKRDGEQMIGYYCSVACVTAAMAEQVSEDA